MKKETAVWFGLQQFPTGCAVYITKISVNLGALSVTSQKLELRNEISFTG